MIKYGRLTALYPMGKDSSRNVIWAFLCECGGTKIARMAHVRSGNTVSCGCYRIDHGHCANGKVSKTYRAWMDMKSRCLNPNATGYDDYGGRGIKICGEWVNSFERFLEDMGEAPIGMMLERIDNNGNYELRNCKWVTRLEQNRNRRPFKRTGAG